MKITIQNIIRWEQLRGKTFSTFDTSVEDDVIALMYVTTPAKDIDNSLFSEYREVTKDNPKLVAKQANNINRYLSFVNQFYATKKEDKELDPMALQKEGEEQKPTSIGNVAMNLLYSGVDANYLMHDAEICDLPLLSEGAEGKVKQDYENSRLWTYLNTLPYVDQDQCKSPHDFYPFPWETEGKIVSDDDMEMAESILGGKEAENG